MTATYSAVIGVNYGDEGKGLVVDWLSDKNTLVVRANGGAQAGHTVVSPSGARHIFSHFGSGYFHGAATYLGPHFLVSPLQFRKELAVLQTLLSLEKRPNFYLNGRSPVVTPFDMKINQLLERNRGKQKHGSCGVGIFETWHRHNHLEGITVTVSDLFGNREILKDKLHEIKTKWVPYRLRALSIADDIDLDVRPYLQAVDFLLKNSELVGWGDLLPAVQFERVVFEGAQGLMLDMENQDMFPHLTPSKTGLKNVLELMPNHSSLNVYYVTRSYATRHGNGPLPHEGMDFKPRIFDQTNVTNEFQGSIRTAPLDLDLMMGAIGKEVKVSDSMSVSCAYNLLITHLDAFPYQDKKNLALQIVTGGKLETHPMYNIVTKIEENCRCLIRSIYGSNGPTREHIFKI